MMHTKPPTTIRSGMIATVPETVLHQGFIRGLRLFCACARRLDAKGFNAVRPSSLPDMQKRKTPT